MSRACPLLASVTVIDREGKEFHSLLPMITASVSFAPLESPALPVSLLVLYKVTIWRQFSVLVLLLS